MKKPAAKKSADPNVVKVLVVDDHPIVRQGIKSLLEIDSRFQVAWEAANGPQAITIVEKATPDAAVVDISLEGSDGLELIKNLRAMDYAFPILVVSMHEESLYAERVLRAGGNGYVMKRELSDNLLRALERIIEGKIYVSDAIQERFLKDISGKNRKEGSGVESLSDRELEVFRLMGNGLSTREIADKLRLSIKTIETYRAYIKEKLDISTAPELVSRATRWVQEQQGA
ncbi:MAG: response regulator transcription factor [Kiritimatiellia bacterium]